MRNGHLGHLRIRFIVPPNARTADLSLILIRSSPPAGTNRQRHDSLHLSDIEGGAAPVSQCVGLSVIVSLSSPPAIN